jgi:hypothetical protein
MIASGAISTMRMMVRRADGELEPLTPRRPGRSRRL